MNEDENRADRGFLSRWSQRKREAKLPDADGAAAQADQEETASPTIAEAGAEDAFDVSSLPKLDEVTASTDITGFLRKGVPEGVRNAALRKSWALDPAIRNYVNPALDYAYDWNTPGGVPGNSELAVGTDIAKMVLQIMGNDSTNQAEAVVPDAQAIASPHQSLHYSDAPDPIDDPSQIAALQYSGLELAGQPARLSTPAISTTLTEDFASSAIAANNGRRNVSPPDPAGAMQQPGHRHGSAKPRV